jgi:hypothetical protein
MLRGHPGGPIRSAKDDLIDVICARGGCRCDARIAPVCASQVSMLYTLLAKRTRRGRRKSRHRADLLIEISDRRTGGVYAVRGQKRPSWKIRTATSGCVGHDWSRRRPSDEIQRIEDEGYLQDHQEDKPSKGFLEVALAG